MKTICLYFEIHQIIHLRRYRFFDIGTDHYYYDDYENERSITDIVQRSYKRQQRLLQGGTLPFGCGHREFGKVCT